MNHDELPEDWQFTLMMIIVVSILYGFFLYGAYTFAMRFL